MNIREMGEHAFIIICTCCNIQPPFSLLNDVKKENNAVYDSAFTMYHYRCVPTPVKHCSYEPLYVSFRIIVLVPTLIMIIVSSGSLKKCFHHPADFNIPNVVRILDCFQARSLEYIARIRAFANFVLLAVWSRTETTDRLLGLKLNGNFLKGERRRSGLIEAPPELRTYSVMARKWRYLSGRWWN